MRIVSLHPDATAWLVAFGADTDLVGTTHQCHVGNVGIPVVTSPEPVSRSKDEDVPPILRDGVGPFPANWENVRALNPDLIVAEIRHESGWISLHDVEEAYKRFSGKEVPFFSYRPQILKQVMDLAIKMGKASGRLAEALTYCGDIEIRIKKMQIEYGYDPKRLQDAPRVAGLVSLDPLLLGGGWLPDIVEWAGGISMLVKQGRPDVQVSMEEIRSAKPDFLLVASSDLNTSTLERNLAAHVPVLLDGVLGHSDHRRIRAFGSDTGLFQTGPRIYDLIPVIASWIQQKEFV